MKPFIVLLMCFFLKIVLKIRKYLMKSFVNSLYALNKKADLLAGYSRVEKERLS